MLGTCKFCKARGEVKEFVVRDGTRNRTLKLCVDPSGNSGHSNEVMLLFAGWRVVREAPPEIRKI